MASVSADRHVAICKPGKPGFTSFSKTLALFFIQFFSFWKMKVYRTDKMVPRAYQKKLAGYMPGRDAKVEELLGV